MADSDWFRNVVINSNEDMEISLSESDGTIVDLSSAYNIEFLVRRSQDASTKVYNSLITGTDDVANVQRVFVVGNPTGGIVTLDISGLTLRNTNQTTLDVRVRVYSDSSRYKTYPQERPLREQVTNDVY